MKKLMPVETCCGIKKTPMISPMPSRFDLLVIVRVGVGDVLLMASLAKKPLLIKNWPCSRPNRETTFTVFPPP